MPKYTRGHGVDEVPGLVPVGGRAALCVPWRHRPGSFRRCSKRPLCLLRSDPPNGPEARKRVVCSDTPSQGHAEGPGIPGSRALPSLRALTGPQRALWHCCWGWGRCPGHPSAGAWRGCADWGGGRRHCPPGALRPLGLQVGTASRVHASVQHGKWSGVVPAEEEIGKGQVVTPHM